MGKTTLAGRPAHLHRFLLTDKISAGVVKSGFEHRNHRISKKLHRSCNILMIASWWHGSCQRPLPHGSAHVEYETCVVSDPTRVFCPTSRRDCIAACVNHRSSSPQPRDSPWLCDMEAQLPHVLLGVTGSVAGVKFAQLAAKLSRHAEVRFICLWQHGGAPLWAVLWPVACGCLRFRSNGLPSGRSVALLPLRASPGMLCLRARGSRCMRAVAVLVRCSPPPVWP